MYNIIMYACQLGIAIAALFDHKVRKMWRGERDAFRVLREKVDPTARYVWFHAASLGEFEQGRPLMERLRQEHPEYKILLTFYSPSGYEVRKDYKGADIICYMPVDTVTNARRFLRTIRPVMAFFIKYEFWYNHLHILKHRGIPTYSVSSIFRPDQVFFKWYGHQYGKVLRCFTHYFVQNEQSRQLLAKLNIHDVDVVGDTRFDRVLQIKAAAKQLDIVKNFIGSGNRVFVAGSSWEPDEDVYIPYLAKQSWKTIVATHVVSPQRIKLLQERFESLGKKVLLYTAAQEAGAETPFETYDVLIIDCYGLLSSVYQYADVTYVGGGFGVGIHNLLEAAVWDVPVLFGPNNQKFQEAQDLKACGGGVEISCAQDFEKTMDKFSTSLETLKEAGQKAGSYVASLTGATEKIFSIVKF